MRALRQYREVLPPRKQQVCTRWTPSAGSKLSGYVQIHTHGTEALGPNRFAMQGLDKLFLICTSHKHMHAVQLSWASNLTVTALRDVRSTDTLSGIISMAMGPAGQTGTRFGQRPRHAGKSLPKYQARRAFVMDSEVQLIMRHLSLAALLPIIGDVVLWARAR